MSRTATVKAFTGTEWKAVTGRIVLERDSGLAVECERGIRYWATMDRVTVQTPPTAAHAMTYDAGNDLLGAIH